jgi:UDP-glucuronate 4-epimerase
LHVKKTVLITGTAGFIGYHLAERLLASGHRVIGVDALTDYYDVRLKRARHERLSRHPLFTAHVERLEDAGAMMRIVDGCRPEAVVHLAAQAGVRYSLENPRAYVESNLVGTFNLMEAVRETGTGHLLMASTSSVYGANTEMPFGEGQKADTPLTLYAATKRANEHMAHAQAHIWGTPITMLRFFTVYGAWGRPDLALFKFVEAALADREIDVYNGGEMVRDFTYVEDLTLAIERLIDVPPPSVSGRAGPAIPGDTLSPVAPYRVVNIGNGQPVPLMSFIEEIERALGRPIRKRMLPMQPGDVPATHADTDLLEALTGARPTTPVRDGIRTFVDWYLSYHG